jgi:hypothetical protein
MKGTFVINFSIWLTSQGVISPPIPLPITQINTQNFDLKRKSAHVGETLHLKILSEKLLLTIIKFQRDKEI